MFAKGVRAVLAVAVAAASCSVAAERAPFDEFIGERSMMVSNDGYGVWVYWGAEKATLEYPGRTPFKHHLGTEDNDFLVMLEAACRADGKGQGRNDSEPVRALSLPMHPDTGDVPSFFTPWYWWRVLRGNEATSTPVTVTVGTGKGHESRLVERHVDWSFARPQLLVRIPPAEAMRALLEGTDTEITVRGHQHAGTVTVGTGKGHESDWWNAMWTGRSRDRNCWSGYRPPRRCGHCSKGRIPRSLSKAANQMKKHCPR